MQMNLKKKDDMYVTISVLPFLHFQYLTRTIMETDNIEAYFFMQVVWSAKKISAVAFE